MKKISGFVALGGTAILFIWLISYNVKNNNDFLDVQITGILSLMAVVYLSFFLTQKMNNQKRKVDNAVKLLEKIQKIISQDMFLNLDTKENRSYALMLHRSVSNKLRIVESYNLLNKNKKQIKSIDESLQEIRDTYSAYPVGALITDQDSLKIKNYISLIDDKCDEIQQVLSI